MLNFFKKTVFLGIDINDSSVEVIALSKKRQVLASSRIILEDGIVRNGDIADREKLAEKLKELFETAHPKPIKIKNLRIKSFISLPETKTFVHILEVRKGLSGDDLEQAIIGEAKKNIPIEQERSYWDFFIINPNFRGYQLILYASAPKETVDNYMEVLSQLQINTEAIDLESISLARALLSSGGYFRKLSAKADLNASMIVNVGSHTTGMSVFDNNGNLNLSINTPIGDGNLADAKKILGKLADNIAQTVSYYEEKYKQKIGEIILVGGFVSLPNLDASLSAILKKRVSIGEPLNKVLNRKMIDSASSVFFANAIGLALRGIEAESQKKDINLLSRAKENKTQKEDNWLLKKKVIIVISALFIFAVLLGIAGWIIFFSGQNSMQNSEVITLPEASIEPLQETPEPTPSAQKKIMVVITATPTGWLNVRKGPATTYAQITRIYPGKKYEFIEKQDNWYKIKINDTTEGWITSEYAIIEESQ